MRLTIAALSAAGLIVAAAVPERAEATPLAAGVSTPSPESTAPIIRIDDDDDNGRVRTWRRAPPSHYRFKLYHHNWHVRRYVPHRRIVVPRYRQRTYRTYVPRRHFYVQRHQYRTYRTFVPRKHWRGDDDDD